MSFFAIPQTDEWGEVTYSLTIAGYTALIICMLALLLLGNFLFNKGKKTDVRQLAFSAMAIALATVTSMIRLFTLPAGGEVTLLSMFFIVLIGYWYGLGAGLSTAVAYGILQIVINPYILSIPQVLCDYIFAFGALGLSGIMKDRDSKWSLQIGYLIGALARLFFSFLSGCLFFAAYAYEYGFKSVALYSIAYNGSYIGLEALVTIVIISMPHVSKGLNYVKNLAK